MSERASKTKKMKEQTIYLLTQKEDGKALKYAHTDWKAGVENFNREVAIYRADGYEVAEQTMYDDEVYVKIAKMTKGSSVVRMRLENIVLFKS